MGNAKTQEITRNDLLVSVNWAVKEAIIEEIYNSLWNLNYSKELEPDNHLSVSELHELKHKLYFDLIIDHTGAMMRSGILFVEKIWVKYEGTNPYILKALENYQSTQENINFLKQNTL